MKDSDQDTTRRAGARRRAKGFSWETRLSQDAPGEGGSRWWVWGGAAILVLLFVTFVSGVRVGKELSQPSPKKEASSFLPERAGQKIPIRVADSSKGSSREMEGKSGSSEYPDKPKGREALDSKGKEKSIGEKESDGSSRTVSPTSSPAKASPPPKSKYTLQIAALNSHEEAKEMVIKLKSKGYEAYAVTGSAAAKGTLHRVRIGSFSSLQDARQFAVEFEKKEKIKTIITSP